MLEKEYQVFFWGHTITQKMLHLISWKNICTPSSQGGLGIKLNSTKISFHCKMVA